MTSRRCKYIDKVKKKKKKSIEEQPSTIHMLKTKIGRNRNHLHTHIQRQQLETLGRSQR
jgi:hypothetical protein